MTKRPKHEGTASMSNHLHLPEDCRAVSEVLARVGDKWTILVVVVLGEEPKRFNEIRRSLGSISQRMLTLTLRALERDGLLTRTVTPTVPVTVTYELTDLGVSLQAVMRGIKAWAETNMDEVLANRERYDSRDLRP